MIESYDLSTDKVRPVTKRSTPLKMLFCFQCSKQTACPEKKTNRQSQNQQQDPQNIETEKIHATLQDMKQKVPNLHCGTALRSPETTKVIKLSPTPEVILHKHSETSVDHHKLPNYNNHFASQTTQETQRLEYRKLFDLIFQTSPPKGSQTRNYGSATEQFREILQTGSGLVSVLISSNFCQTETQDTENHRNSFSK